jgi:uncharacterized protein (DUF433 family)
MGSGDVDAVSGTPPHKPQITKDAHTLGGAAHIKGTRVRVSDIVVDYNYHGLAPEAIAEEYRPITVADVYAALAYFDEHTQDIRAEIRDREQALGAAEGE